jgi:hypothetical protein
MKVTEFWVIYHHDSGRDLRKKENYYSRMTGIGPAFGATFETTPRFATRADTTSVTRYFSALVMVELQHVAVVAPEDRTFPTCGLVQHYANLAIEASFNRAAREEVLREAQEEEDSERAAVREPEPGQGVQFDARGQEPEEVEATDGSSGEASRNDRPEVPREEAVPGAEGGRAGGVTEPPWELQVEPYDKSAFREPVKVIKTEHVEIPFFASPPETTHTMGDSVADIEDKRFLAELDKLIGQPEMGMGCSAKNLVPAVAHMSKGDFEDITRVQPESPQTIEDVRFYVDSMTRVDGDEHTQDPEGDWPRVSGDMVCEQCGKTFYKHPLDGPEGFQGKFLNRLCDGRLVKL